MSKTKEPKTKEPTAKVIRKRKIKGGPSEEVEVPVEETLFSGLAETKPIELGELAEVDIFTQDLSPVTALDVSVAVSESSKKKKDITAFLPPDLRNVDLRQQASTLRNSIDTCQFELGRVLYFIKVNKSCEEWGYKDFSSYLREEEAGKYRKSKYLVDLHEWFVTKVKDERKIEAIKSVGWTKAKDIQRVIDEGDDKSVDRWVESALKLNAEDLAITVRNEIQERENKRKNLPPGEIPNTKGPMDLPGETETPKEKKEVMVFKLYSEDYLLVTQMLEWAKKESGSDDPSRNISLVAQEFLMNVQSGDKNSQDYKKKYLERVQERLNIKVIAIDNTENKVFFGAELLE